ncbi:hypothetical protein EP7_005199 [Isosphaeraceae bacterium EP7]
MSASNSRRTAPIHSGFEYAGVVARAHRGTMSSRAGRRSALLGVLTSVYANANRGPRTAAEPQRSGTDRA